MPYNKTMGLIGLVSLVANCDVGRLVFDLFIPQTFY
jgi:hypothetical protein